MLSYRHLIYIECSNLLKEHNSEQRTLVLDYCEEYIEQYRKDNPSRSLPQMRYIVLMAMDKLKL
jgi:hypothetical protein